MSSDRRKQIIDRIQRLPDNHLARIEELLANLECGDLSPLSLDKANSTPRDQHQIPPWSSAPTTLSSRESSPKEWPHAPIHRLGEHGTYIVTAGTLQKQHFFHDADRLDMLESTLLRTATEFGWQLEAWAVFSNHYHFVGHSPASATDAKSFINHLHAESALELNRLDGCRGRMVWHNFWDTRLTFEKSYLARLNYVHQNPAKHGLVRTANEYRWCSAAWFERAAKPAQVKTIYGFKTDKVRLVDDFEPLNPFGVR